MIFRKTICNLSKYFIFNVHNSRVLTTVVQSSKINTVTFEFKWRFLQIYMADLQAND